MTPSAQNAEDRAPLHDAEHHRVVDEEHAHDQGQQAQGGEVQLESGGELGHGLAPARRPEPGAAPAAGAADSGRGLGLS